MQIYSSSFHRRHRLLAAIPQLQETLFHASRPTGAMADIQTPQADVGNSALPRYGQGGVQASNHSTEALVSAGNQDGLTHLNITYPQSLSPRAEAVVEQILQDNFGERKVIRHGCKVTKINNTPQGPMRISNEAATLHYRREHTTIPVPTVYEATSNSVTMDFIEGSNLEEAWNDLSDTESTAIAEQLGDYLVQLRNLRRSVIGSFDSGPALDSRFFINQGGPFQTVSEYIDFVLSDPPRNWPGAAPLHNIVRSQMRTNYDVVFTHGDLKGVNIIVKGARIEAIIDWEYAGYYPEYLEIVSALRAAQWDCPYYAALLDIFPQRYDAEYVTDFLVSRITRNGM